GATEFTEEDDQALVVLACQAGVAVENARLYEEAHQHRRRLEAIREITALTLEGADTKKVLQLVARRARELAGADLATIAAPGEEQGMLVLAVADGYRTEDLLGRRFPIGGSISGEVMVTGRAVVVGDVWGGGRW